MILLFMNHWLEQSSLLFLFSICQDWKISLMKDNWGLQCTVETSLLSYRSSSPPTAKQSHVQSINECWKTPELIQNALYPFLIWSWNRFHSAPNEFDFVFEDGNCLHPSDADTMLNIITNNLRDLFVSSGCIWDPVHERWIGKDS